MILTPLVICLFDNENGVLFIHCSPSTQLQPQGTMNGFELGCEFGAPKNDTTPETNDAI